MRNTHSCPICNERLRLCTCLTCKGTGTVPRLLFFKQPCDACEGSGQQVRCPNLEAHLAQGGEPISTSANEICPVCKGGGVLRPVIMAAEVAAPRCYYCHGSGLVPKDRRRP